MASRFIPLTAITFRIYVFNPLYQIKTRMDLIPHYEQFKKSLVNFGYQLYQALAENRVLLDNLPE